MKTNNKKKRVSDKTYFIACINHNTHAIESAPLLYHKNKNNKDIDQLFNSLTGRSLIYPEDC